MTVNYKTPQDEPQIALAETLGRGMTETTTKTLLATPKRRKLDAQDLKNVTKLIIRQKCTEKAACLHLGINPEQFAVWKCRNGNSARFDNLIARAKEQKLEGLLNNIEDVGNGIGVKQRDWRASAWIAERIAPERFALQRDGQQTGVTALVVSIDAMAAIVARLPGMQQVKHLGDKPVVETEAIETESEKQIR